MNWCILMNIFFYEKRNNKKTKKEHGAIKIIKK